MKKSLRSKRLVLFENATHYLTAFVVLLKGADKLYLGKPGIGITFLLIGAIILAGTIFHHKAQRLLRHFKAFVYTLEAVVMSIVGYQYWADGKTLIQYVCFLAAAMFLVALVVYIRKTRKSPSAIPH